MDGKQYATRDEFGRVRDGDGRDVHCEYDGCYRFDVKRLIVRNDGIRMFCTQHFGTMETLQHDDNVTAHCCTKNTRAQTRKEKDMLCPMGDGVGRY